MSFRVMRQLVYLAVLGLALFTTRTASYALPTCDDVCSDVSVSCSMNCEDANYSVVTCGYFLADELEVSDACGQPYTTGDLIGASDDINTNVTGTDLSDAQAALTIAYSYGVIDSPPDDLSDASTYIANSGAGLTCAKKQEILNSLNKATLYTGVASGALWVGAGVAVYLFPPAAAGLGTSAGLVGILSGITAYAYNQVSNLPCT